MKRTTHWSAKCLLVLSMSMAPWVVAAAPATDPSLSDPSRFTSTDGEFLYRAACQGCHMPQGEGAVGAGAYPALAENPRLQAAAYPIFLILKGRKAMPAFNRLLDDAQVASLVTYIRTHFGNDYADEVTPALVESIRQ